ncbi:spermidine/putrescine ABC transporter substrate-binding protein [Candidatus Bathyarchaeota archaeon]|nr:spermidine/putrescine ABC transporter substrate-binding protein [Candidatus Bathyarchaeota archaeon]
MKIAGTGAAGLAIGGAAGYVGIRSLEDQIARIDLKGHLNIFNWTYYLNRPRLDRWCGDHGIALSYDTYESGDALLGKLEGAYPGATGYDICVMTDSDIPYAIDQGYFEPIDLDKIPNFELIPDEFIDPDYDPENEYTVIYSYGTTGIGWNSDEVTEGITKWADIFDPARGILDKYNKKITMMKDTIEVLAAAMFYLGLDPNSCEEDDLNAAKEALITQKPYLATYAETEEIMTGLETGDFVISHGWNGDIGGIVYESSETEIKLEKVLPNIRYVVPEEGGIVWFDNFAIPKGAPHPKAAHAFINFMLDPKTAAINTMSVKYPFPTGRDLVPEALREDPLIFTPPELRAKLTRTRTFTEEERTLRDAVWTEVQAA